LVVGARQINNNQLPHPAAASAATTAGDASQVALQHRHPITFSSAAMSAQLNQIEQQITREMSQLSHLSDQLHVLRALQGELARLRGAQGIPGHPGPSPPYQSRQPVLQQSVQAYREVPVGSGQRNLPAGMTIPEGWTLHALHRIPGSAYRGPQTGASEEALQRQQSANDYPQPQANQNHGVPIDVGGSSNAAQASDTGVKQDTTQEVGLASSEAEGDQAEASVPQGGETSCGPPAWGSANGRQSAAESSEPKHQSKGKGKAVTVEDDAEDANA